MIAKPAYGHPCNSCGLCCQFELCPLGAAVFRRTNGPCPALEPQADGRKICGLIANPMTYARVETMKLGAARMSEGAVHLIGAGHGCDAIDFGEKPDPAARAKMLSGASPHSRASRKAKRDWGLNG